MDNYLLLRVLKTLVTGPSRRTSLEGADLVSRTQMTGLRGCTDTKQEVFLVVERQLVPFQLRNLNFLKHRNYVYHHHLRPRRVTIPHGKLYILTILFLIL